METFAMIVGVTALIYLVVGAMFTSIFFTLLRHGHMSSSRVSRRRREAVYSLVVTWPYMIWLLIKNALNQTGLTSPKPPNRTRV